MIPHTHTHVPEEGTQQKPRSWLRDWLRERAVADEENTCPCDGNVLGEHSVMGYHMVNVPEDTSMDNVKGSEYN